MYTRAFYNARFNAFHVMLLFLILSICPGCSSPGAGPDSTGVIHLIDTDSRLPLWAEGTERTVLSADSAGSDKAYVLAEVDGSFRRAMMVSVDDPGIFEFTASSPGDLQFWVAIRSSGEPVQTDAITLHVDAQDLKNKVVRELSVDKNGQWVKVDIPLEDLIGTIQCRFRVAGSENGSIQKDVCVLIGSPMLIYDAPSKLPNVFLIVIDSLRAEDTGAYGSSAADTPFMDEYSRQSVTYTQAISSSSWTLPAVKNMMSGRYTNVVAREGENLYDMQEPFDVIQQLFAQNNWFTAAVSGNHLVDVDRGFDRGFSLFDPKPSRRYKHGSSEDIYHRTRALILENHDKPIFLYLHIMDPHDPYTPLDPFYRICDPPPDSAVREKLRSKETGHLNHEKPEVQNALTDLEKEYLHDHYRGEIRQVDTLLLLLFRCLQEFDILENSIVVITSDHGEEFGEHGYYQHSKTLYQQSVSIPFILKNPESPFAGVLEKERVSTIDLPVSLASMAGLMFHAGSEGLRIYPPGNPALKTRPLFSVLQHKLQNRSARNVWRAIYRESQKIIWNSQSGWNCYDLQVSPDEMQYMTEPEYETLKASPRFEIWRESAAILANFMENENIQSDVESDQQLTHKLRQLGYVN